MKIGLLSFRLGGLDGVALEAENWRKVLVRMGHKVVPIAGEFEGRTTGIRIPLLNFLHPRINQLTDKLFYSNKKRITPLLPEVYAIADRIERDLERIITDQKIDFLIVKNVLSLLVNYPAAIATNSVIEKTKIPTIARHHDFPWGRPRFTLPELQIKEEIANLLPRQSYVKHVVISSIGKRQFSQHAGLDSQIIPDSFDFKNLPARKDRFNSDFKKRLGLDPDRKTILQATRFVPRKKIERTIELAAKIKTPTTVLLTSSSYAKDEPGKYLNTLKQLIKELKVSAVFADKYIAPHRVRKDGIKTYSFWDAYLFADLFAYTSDHEGFGNQFLEAIAFKLPIFVNRYPVYKSDIEPLGFEAITIDGEVTDEAVRRIDSIFSGEESVERMVNKNFEIGQKYFSFEALEKKLDNLLTS